MRVKYFDGNPKTGNCEVFAEVVATRLFWALDFDADAMVSAAIDALPPRADKDRQRKHFDALALLATACSSSRLTVQDLGATLGGAGFITNARSKVQLASWAKTNVFPGPRVASGTCRGQSGIALGAGSKAGGNLGIGAAGRQFLFERLSPPTPAHVRTLFETARLDELGEPQQWQDASGKVHTGYDGWAAACAQKVAEVGARRCTN